MTRAMLLGLCMMLAGLSHAQAQDRFQPLAAHDQLARMGAGVNVLGYDDYWKPGAQGNYREEHFAAIREAGFSTVRVVLFTFPHLDDAGRLDPRWLDKLDQVVAWGRNHDLQMILDVHDFMDCAEDAATCTTKLRQVWKQLGTRYADQPASLMFELLNEPHGQLDVDAWNALLPQLLAVVRETNPTRNVVVGPASWNSFRYLDRLQLPEDDRHLIVTFHYYEPFEFTHQGASWVGPEISGLSGIGFGSAGEVAQVGKDFDQVRAWSLRHDRPVFLGEFGAYGKAALEDRVRWTSTVARAAEARGFAWAYWQFSSDFIVYDFQQQAWVQPILKALLPQSPAVTD